MKAIAVILIAFLVAMGLPQSYRVETTPLYAWYALNDHGDLAGAVDEPNNHVATVRYRNGIVERLNLPPVINVPVAINNAGVVTGRHSTGEDGPGGYLFAETGQLIDVTSPEDLNDRNEVVGITFVNDQQSGAFWRNGELIGVPPRFLTRTVFRAINNNTEVVGYERTQEFTDFVPIYWTEETGTIRLSTETNTANDINDNGFIVGDQTVWHRGQFHHSIEGTGMFINNSNHILGVTQNGFSLWRDNGPELLENLYDDSRWRIALVTDFNNRGQILAEAWFNGSSQVQTIILTPVPEPGAVATLALGSLALALRRRQRHR